MTIALILAKKILSLFIVIFAGWLLVKLKLLKAEDSKPVSMILLYLITPCVIISSFEVEATSDVRSGLILSATAGACSMALLIVLGLALGKVLKLDPVEKLSVVFSNAGNLIIPLVSSILGSEWVIYTSAFMSVQLLLLWSYGKAVLCGERKPEIRKIVTNVNLIAIMIGIVMFFCGIRLPGVLQDAVDQMGSMIGPATMLVTGMLIAGMDVKRAIARKRLWLIVVLRLIVCPVFTLLFLKFVPFASYVPEGKTVILITLLATVTPSASSITQMAQVYGKNAEYASAINVITTLLCIVTVPVFAALYML